jgi:4-hydroxy-3-polyprenylbenzoate decarboxylase
MDGGESRPRRFVIGMTGATGVIYGVRLLEALHDSRIETHLVMSRWARRTLIAETDRHPDEVQGLATHAYDEDDLSAPIGTGSFIVDGMAVVPCSMRSLAAISHGVSQNLIHRAADVALKEGRRLVLVVRESPLSVIHLENLVRVAQAGAIVAPPVPAFYAKLGSLDEMIDHTVGRLLDHLGVEHDLIRRWGEPRLRPVRLESGENRSGP